MKFKYLFMSMFMTVMGVAVTSCTDDDSTISEVEESKPKISISCYNPDGTVSRGSNDGGSWSGEGSYFPHESATVSASANTGYVISSFGGSGGGNSYSGGSGETSYSFSINDITSDYSFSVSFEKKQVQTYSNSVYVANAGIGGSASGDATGEPGTRHAISASADRNYEFEYWSCEGGASVDNSSSPSTYGIIGNSNGKIYAHFKEKPHEVKYYVSWSTPSRVYVSDIGDYRDVISCYVIGTVTVDGNSHSVDQGTRGGISGRATLSGPAADVSFSGTAFCDYDDGYGGTSTTYVYFDLNGNLDQSYGCSFSIPEE